MTLIEIAEPRYHDMVALVGAFKVKDPNELYTVTFTKGFYKGRKYQMRGKKIIEYPLQTNGTIDCYAVPLAKFREVK